MYDPWNPEPISRLEHSVFGVLVVIATIGMLALLIHVARIVH